mgnify:CR=1 FL=1
MEVSHIFRGPPRAQLAYANGASYEKTGQVAGVSKTTAFRYVHGTAGVVRLHSRQRKVRGPLEEREEIRVGIERGESDALYTAVHVSH